MNEILEQVIECQMDWSGFLGRDPFTTCVFNSDGFISRKTVLVTGAGGSIGSSLARSLTRGNPKRLVLLDHSRRSLAALQNERLRSFGFGGAVYVEGSILDRTLLEKTFDSNRPDIVFHAAALKHLVPLERNPFEAMETNVFGTANLMEIAFQYGSERLVNVSTDKAVYPTSILGASKRIAELLLLRQQQSSGVAQSIRLGNVLGSSGSVAPIFMNALRSRQPLQVTEPEASRYFVTMEEAAGFVAESLAVDHTSLLLPEMGRPKTICELAGFLAGAKQRGAARQSMVRIGLRDGEKHAEQLTYRHESLRATKSPYLHEICGNSMDEESFNAKLSALKNAVGERRGGDLIGILLALVPEFTPSRALRRSAC